VKQQQRQPVKQEQQEDSAAEALEQLLKDASSSTSSSGGSVGLLAGGVAGNGIIHRVPAAAGWLRPIRGAGVQLHIVPARQQHCRQQQQWDAQQPPGACVCPVSSCGVF